MIERVGLDLAKIDGIEALRVGKRVEKRTVGLEHRGQSGIARDVDVDRAAPVVERDVEGRVPASLPLRALDEPAELLAVRLEAEDAQMTPRRQPVLLEPTPRPHVCQDDRVPLVHGLEARIEEHVHGARRLKHEIAGAQCTVHCAGCRCRVPQCTVRGARSTILFVPGPRFR